MREGNITKNAQPVILPAGALAYYSGIIKDVWLSFPHTLSICNCLKTRLSPYLSIQTWRIVA